MEERKQDVLAISCYCFFDKHGESTALHSQFFDSVCYDQFLELQQTAEFVVDEGNLPSVFRQAMPTHLWVHP